MNSRRTRAKTVGRKKQFSRPRQVRSPLPRTLQQFNESSERLQTALTKLTDVVARMRKEGLSLSKAAREAGTSPKAIRGIAGSAIVKQVNGRYTVSRSDQLLRVLKVPTAQGTQEIGVRGSRQASTLGEYWSAVHKYLATGEASVLKKFQGRSIKTDNGNTVSLIADTTELKHLGRAGVLSFESLYARSS